MKHFIKTIIQAAILFPVLTACDNYNLLPYKPVDESKDSVELHFGPRAGLIDSSIWTKSVNAVEVEENKIIGAALGIYDSEGILVYSDVVAGEFVSFSKPVKLNKNKAYSCYLVTGYIADKISYPDNEDGLAGLEIVNTQTNAEGEYDLSSTLKDYGPDRVGSLIKMTPELLDLADNVKDGKVTIPVKSLWAKVSVDLDLSEIEYTDLILGDRGVQSCGAVYGSRVFMPFAPDGCKNISDRFALLPAETRTAQGSSTSGPFVFYVPENMLGELLPNNSVPEGKTPAEVGKRHGEAVMQAVEKNAVVVSTPASSDWGEWGTLIYRFCLGNNETTNFDIKRNTHYNVTLKATENGFRIKEWKAELDISDSRALSLKAIAREEKNLRPCFRDTTFLETSLSDDFYLVPDYSLPDVDMTFTDYDTSPGWDLTASTKEQLESLGISYSLEKKYVFVTSLDRNVHIGDTPASRYAIFRDYVYYDGTEAKTDLLHFSPSSELPAGLAFPVSIQTHDGKHTATATVQTKADGTAVVSWGRKPEYIAQQGLLKTSSTSGSVKQVTFSVESTYADMIEVAPAATNSCIVKIKKAGESYVTYYGKTEGGTTVCTGTVRVSAKIPLLVAGPSLCELSPDGTAATIRTTYANTSGEEMTVAETDEDGYGLFFAPSLFNSILSPQISVTQSALAPFLGCSGQQVYVSRLYDNDSSVKPYLGITMNNALEVRALNSNQIEKVNLGVKVKSPVAPHDPDNRIGCIDNHIVTNLAASHPQSAVVKQGVTAILPGLRFTYGAAIENLSVEETPDFKFKCSADGRLSVTGKTNPAALSAGKLPLKIECRNFRANQSLTTSAGYLDVYLHTAPVGVLDLSKTYKEVSADIAGAELSEGLMALRTKLFQDGYAVRCNFDNGSFYSYGYGLWSYIDEYDSMGNQYTAPYQRGMMTEFQDRAWQNYVKFGDVAYTIAVGTLEDDAGKYSSMNNFLMYNETTRLVFDFSGLGYLAPSPFGAEMYHFAYGQETDSYGHSYYVIDRKNNPGWK